jgi:hypothetical protein
VVVTAVVTSALVGCSVDGSSAPADAVLTAPTGSAASTAPTSPRASPQVAFPVRTIDVADTEPVALTVVDTVGSAPTRPWLRTVGESGRYRAVVTWRRHEAVLPVGTSPIAVMRNGIAVTGAYGTKLRFVDWSGRMMHVPAAPHGAIRAVVGTGRQLLWSAAGPGGDDILKRWVPGRAVRRVTIDPGERPRRASRLRIVPVGSFGAADHVYGNFWKTHGVQDALTYARTSGRPAAWQLSPIWAISPATELVAGWPRQVGGGSNCVAVYRSDGDVPLWTRCFLRRGKPVEARVEGFDRAGRRLLVTVAGGGWAGPAASFHIGRNTLLSLDAKTGRVASRLDANAAGQVSEGDDSFLFVQHRLPLGWRQGRDEGPYESWIVRCSWRGRCERATVPVPNDTFHPWGVQLLSDRS